MKINKVINSIIVAIEVFITVYAIAATAFLIAKNFIPEEKTTYINFDSFYSENTIHYEVRTLEASEFELFARTVYAEAGNQGMLGKRLVAAVILNRADDPAFPDTVKEVIEAPGQFAVISSGAIYKYELDDETIEACKLELTERTSHEIFYFNTKGFKKNKQWAKVGDHYFSKK